MIVIGCISTPIQEPSQRPLQSETMAVKVGGSVLVRHGSLLLDAEVKELQESVQTEENGVAMQGCVLVHYVVESGWPDEWVTRDRVLEDTQASRERQMESKAVSPSKSEVSTTSTSFEKFCGPKRLDAMAAWMNTVDDALVRMDKDVKDVIQTHADHAAKLIELERRKKEALEKKAGLEAAVLQELKRVKVAEETAMARKRLQTAGVAQEEIDAILPVLPPTV